MGAGRGVSGQLREGAISAQLSAVSFRAGHNLIANPNTPAVRSVAQWFNTAAFQLPAAFMLGNATRNPVRGPGLQNADLMIGKTFRVTEQVAIEFRAEVFNVSNTTPLNDPNGTACCSGPFGSITTAGNPRDFEFAAKVHF